MRAILPAWRTILTAALHQESGIPLVAQLLEATCVRFAARLKGLDAAHPLTVHTRPAEPPVVYKSIKRKYQPSPVTIRTRLRRTDELLPSCKQPVLLRGAYSSE